MRGRVFCGLAIASGLVVFAGCGGTAGTNKGSGASPTTAPRIVVTAAALDQATRAAHTARLDGTATTKQGATTTVERATGELNFDQDAMHLRGVSPSGATVLELISIGKQGWGRGSGPFALQPEWCALELTESFDPGAVLRSLEAAHARLERVGNETIDSVQTTHYRTIVPDVEPTETLNLWVDASDRLRRMIDTSGDTTQTANLYDFGAPIAPITAPSTKDCPHSAGSSSESSPLDTVNDASTP
jgi:hypothetical protein